MGPHQREAVLVVERRVPCNELIGDDAQRILIGRASDGTTEALLGADVGRRADDCTKLRERLRLSDGLADLGDAEVRDVRVAVGIDQDVRGLHVAMKHPLPVRIAQRARDLRKHTADDRDGQGATCLEDGLEGAALDVVHREEVNACRLADGEDADDVRVPQVGDGLGFLLEPAHHAFVRHQLRQDHLHRHLAAESDVLGEIDGGHAPAAERGDEVQLSECGFLHAREDAVPVCVARGSGARLGELGRELGQVHRIAALRAVPVAGDEHVAAGAARVHLRAAAAAEAVVGNKTFPAPATVGDGGPRWWSFAHGRGTKGSGAGKPRHGVGLGGQENGRRCNMSVMISEHNAEGAAYTRGFRGISFALPGPSVGWNSLRCHRWNA